VIKGTIPIADPIAGVDLDNSAIRRSFDQLFDDFVSESSERGLRTDDRMVPVLGSLPQGIRRRKLATVLTVLLLITAFSLTIGWLTGSRTAKQPTWRLVASVTSPFRALPSGSEQQLLQCVTDTICYSPGVGDPSANPFRLFHTTDGGRTWTQSSPVPVTLTGNNLSCSTATSCTVFGTLRNSASQMQVLATTTDGDPVPVS
jgi:hypothetical protein